MCGCLSCIPSWGPGPQPKLVSWLGIKLETLWFTGQHSIHWVTPARDELATLKKKNKQKITSVGKDVKNLKYLCTIPGNVEWCKLLMENTTVVPQNKIKHRTIKWPSNTTTACISKRIKSKGSKRCLHAHSTIHNSQEVEATQISTDR